MKSMLRHGVNNERGVRGLLTRPRKTRSNQVVETTVKIIAGNSAQNLFWLAHDSVKDSITANSNFVYLVFRMKLYNNKYVASFCQDHGGTIVWATHDNIMPVSPSLDGVFFAGSATSSAGAAGTSGLSWPRFGPASLNASECAK